MKAIRNAGALVLGLFIVVVLVVGLFLGGWWLKEYGVNRNAQINQDGYGRQNALVEQILDDIGEAEGSIPDNQRIAVIDGVCDSAAKLTGTIQLPPNAQQFIQENCS